MGATMTKGSGNFLDALPSQGTMHVVMLGLDSAGKTTALYRLKFDQYLNTVPTIGFNCEKVQGTVGKAKGVQFLVWDVGGQEKLRPLWRSYTRCTDGILFVVDSGDVERMEEAKMELMRTAKCPDNQGVPVLILANKQDLPGARDPKTLEKMLGLYELLYPGGGIKTMSSSSSSTINTVGCSSTTSDNCSNNSLGCSLTTATQPNKSYTITKELSINFPNLSSSLNTYSNTSPMEQHGRPLESSSDARKSQGNRSQMYQQQKHETKSTSATPSNSSLYTKDNQFKGWYVQPACAITGEGLQEGLEALYEMILKRRKLNKANKKKR